jgi:diguanylate cyclase (GGDEF)-like protein/PAS domain S-box-containing protein
LKAWYYYPHNYVLSGAAKITAGFGIGFAMLLGLGITAVLQTREWEESARSVAGAHGVIERLDELSLHTMDAEDAAREFIATQDLRDLTRCAEDLNLAKTTLGEVQKLVSANPSQLKSTLTLGRLMNGQSAVLSRGTRSGTRDGVMQALRELDSAGLGSAVRAAILEMKAGPRASLHDGTVWQVRAALMNRTLFAAAAILSMCLFVAAGWRVLTDFGKRKSMEQILAAKEQQYTQVVELAGDIIYSTDEQGRITFCNQTALTMLHFAEGEVIGRSYLKLVRKDYRLRAERFYVRQFGRKQKTTYFEFPIVDGHGRERWVGQNVQLVLKAGRVVAFQGIARDITERKRAEFELQKSRNFVERIAATTPDVLYVYDIASQRNVFSNRDVVTILGYKPEEMRMIEQLPGSIFHPDDLAMIKAHHEALRHAQDGEVRRLEYRARHADGHWVWLSGRETAFERGPDGLVRQIVGIVQDITARKAALDKLAYQANYDALTGLANRRHFWSRLQGALRRAGIEHSQTAVCLFDIDHFKKINDRYGHAEGDEVLEIVGNIVRAEMRANGIAGRLGGDEFCFVLPGAMVDEAAGLAERIRNRLSTLPFGTSSHFHVTATFGVAESQPNLDARVVMEAADRALYHAKAAGRNRVCVDAGLNEHGPLLLSPGLLSPAALVPVSLSPAS